MNDLIFLGDNSRQVGAHITCPHSPARRVSRIVGHLRAMDHGLRWRASGIDARAPDIALFDERHLPSDVRKTKGKRDPSLSRADHYRVIFHTRSPRVPSIIQLG